jgi:Putative glycosyltransferase (DUF6716)
VNPEPAASAAVSVLAIADTDSYLKWSAATLDALPHSWESSQLLIRNPVMPSEAQIRAASSRPVEVLSFGALVRRIRRDCPDVVLLACTGPVVTALTAHRVFWRRNRPVLITGLPGISVPATKRAVAARAACDLFVVHSKREIADFRAFAASQAPRLACGLASLPFLLNRSPTPVADSAHRHHLVFAAQAKVPAARVHREQILLALADAGSAVVKLRAWSEEQQTHNETWSYPKIMEDLVEHGRAAPDAVAFVGGSMYDVLRTARGLVTVSSTAALEAIAMDRPILIISDFGVSAEMINVVFEGSGCLGTLDDLRSGRLLRPDPLWLETNYFHRVVENDWLARGSDLLAVRAAGQLPGRPRLHASLQQRARRRLRLILPVRLWQQLTKYGALAAKARHRRIPRNPRLSESTDLPPPAAQMTSASLRSDR